MIRPTSLDNAKRLLAEGGYDGTKVVMMQPTDIPITSAFTLVAAETMRAMGMEVEIQAMDWSTVTSRRAKKDPVDQGGWNVFHTWWIGGDLVNPIAAVGLAAGGTEKAWFGWPTDEKMEELRDRFAFSSGIEEQKQLGREIQQRAIEIGTHANVGTFFVPCGYRDNVQGLIKSPVQFFWNVSV
jgi:peptide/nickel transport system substrate-binding protein